MFQLILDLRQYLRYQEHRLGRGSRNEVCPKPLPLGLGRVRISISYGGSCIKGRWILYEVEGWKNRATISNSPTRLVFRSQSIIIPKTHDDYPLKNLLHLPSSPLTSRPAFRKCSRNHTCGPEPEGKRTHQMQQTNSTPSTTMAQI